MRELGVWVEITTLLIPGLNDSDQELTQLAEFIVSLDPAIPWHVSAFFPTYKLTDRPATPVLTLQKAREIGLAAGLHHVYEGNVTDSGGENTVCPSCQTRLISRFRFTVQENRLARGCCPQCSEKIAGVWE
jgi:pyruvate formate lyase activating enzyme